MELINNTIAAQYFHGKERFNCCQAVLKAFSHITNMSDSYIEEYYRKSGGGRAPENLCGAVYAAVILLNDRPKELDFVIDEFSRQAGSNTCRGIKSAGLMPCRDCVELIGKLLAETGKFNPNSRTTDSISA